MRKELMQIYVDPHQKEMLEKESKKTGAPMAYIVRQAIELYFKEGN